MMARRLYRSRENRIISGVCGGIGEYFDVDPVLIRIIWAVTVIAYGIGILAYIIALIAIPLEPKPEKNIEEVGSSENNKREKKNRKSVGGLILIGIGVIFLLHNFNFFPWFDIEKLWPVILIVIGIAMLIRQSQKG
jgi:phage shock protein C